MPKMCSWIGCRFFGGTNAHTELNFGLRWRATRHTLAPKNEKWRIFRLIRASIEKLGFRWEDTKILLNGQVHFDYMGGAAESLRETHAKNLVVEGDIDMVEAVGAHPLLHFT